MPSTTNVLDEARRAGTRSALPSSTRSVKRLERALAELGGKAAPAAARVAGGQAAGSATSSRQLAPAAAADVLDLGLRLGVALDRVGGELVDVGEDRLGQQAQLLGVEARPGGRRRRSAARRPGPRPGRRPAASRAVLRPQLAAAEGDVDLAARLAAGLGIADQGDELAQRLPDAGADPAPEAALERRAYSGTSRAIELRISAVIASSSGSIRSATSARKAAPGLGIDGFWHLTYKINAIKRHRH